MQSERRRNRIQRVIRRGRAILPKGRSTVPCPILELSAEGALLQTDQWLLLPESFILDIDNDPRIESRVRQRYLDKIGVEFASGHAHRLT
jgi:hypothetical protein